MPLSSQSYSWSYIMPLISICYFPLNHEWPMAMTMVCVDILGGRARILMMMMCFVNRYPCSFALMGAVLISLLVATKVLVCSGPRGGIFTPLQCIAQGCIFCCWPLYYILYMIHYLDWEEYIASPGWEFGSLRRAKKSLECFGLAATSFENIEGAVFPSHGASFDEQTSSPS